VYSVPAATIVLVQVQGMTNVESVEVIIQTADRSQRLGNHRNDWNTVDYPFRLSNLHIPIIHWCCIENNLKQMYKKESSSVRIVCPNMIFKRGVLKVTETDLIANVLLLLKLIVRFMKRYIYSVSYQQI